MEGVGPGDAGREGRAAGIIGVLGAGTMGAGIAQLACRAGAQALLHDPVAPALERGVQRVRDGLAKEAARRKQYVLICGICRRMDDNIVPQPRYGNLVSL